MQAVNGVGLVSLDDNQGDYYPLGGITPANQTGTQAAGASLQATALQLQAPPGNADFGSSVNLSAKLTAGAAPVPNEPVTFTIGGSTQTATTDANGVASVPLPLVDLPGRLHADRRIRRRRRLRGLLRALGSRSTRSRRRSP